MKRLLWCFGLLWLFSRVIALVSPEIGTGYIVGVAFGVLTVGAVAFIWGWNSHVESAYQSALEVAEQKRVKERR